MVYFHMFGAVWRQIVARPCPCDWHNIRAADRLAAWPQYASTPVDEAQKFMHFSSLKSPEIRQKITRSAAEILNHDQFVDTLFVFRPKRLPPARDHALVSRPEWEFFTGWPGNPELGPEEPQNAEASIDYVPLKDGRENDPGGIRENIPQLVDM